MIKYSFLTTFALKIPGGLRVETKPDIYRHLNWCPHLLIGPFEISIKYFLDSLKNILKVSNFEGKNIFLASVWVSLILDFLSMTPSIPGLSGFNSYSKYHDAKVSRWFVLQIKFTDKHTKTTSKLDVTYQSIHLQHNRSNPKVFILTTQLESITTFQMSISLITDVLKNCCHSEIIKIIAIHRSMYLKAMWLTDCSSSACIV